MDNPFDSFYSKQKEVERFYRTSAALDLQKYRVVVGESDLWVLTDSEIKDELTAMLTLYRRQLKEYIYQHPVFVETLLPYSDDDQAPEIVKWMISASALAGVGPMAAVAGAVAGIIGKHFNQVKELIIENGGDIFLKSTVERKIAVYAGKSPFSGKIGLLIAPQPSGCGVCTSAGTVGPSLSFGRADAAVIIAPDPALADAVATASANIIKNPGDFQTALQFIQSIPEITGALFIKDDKMAAWGEIELIPLEI